VWPQIAIFPEPEPVLPAPSPASFGITRLSDVSSTFAMSLQRPRTIMARGRIPLPPRPVWPRNLDAPVVPPLSSLRTVLPAPSPDSFSYPGAVPTPWLAPKASIDVVPETNGTAIETQRTAVDRLILDDGPPTTGTVPHTAAPAAAGTVPAVAPPQPAQTAPLRGSFTAITMPRGAFP
jgi:hypothetical protein